ncbi:MAG: TetR family transcriptional regulator [Xanthomonadales bacterium]|nr:TetR family transcriptional regulator [Xanthomonadales bacterium]
MARPRKSDHTRQQLLATGSQMMTEHGYHGTGIKQVLDVVGVPKGSFYNFFPSKEAYVASIIYHYGEQVAEEFRAATAGLEGEPALVLLWCSFRNKVRNKLNSGESCACLLGAMSSEIGQASPLSREAINSVEKQSVQTIADLVKEAQSQGDLRDDIPAVEIAPVLYNCWQGNLLQYQVTDDSVLLLRQLNTFIKTLLTPQGQLTFSQSNVCQEEIDHVR